MGQSEPVSSPSGEASGPVSTPQSVENHTRCLTEFSVVWLAGGAIGLSAVLWLAIIAVL